MLLSLKPITIAPETQWLGDYFPRVLVNLVGDWATQILVELDHFPKVGVKMKNIWVATSQLHLGCQVIKTRKWILVGIIHYYSLIKADQLPSIHTDDQLISNHGKPGAERTHWTKTWVSKITLVTFFK